MYDEDGEAGSDVLAFFILSLKAEAVQEGEDCIFYRYEIASY
jgi:hypothetical protein